MAAAKARSGQTRPVEESRLTAYWLILGLVIEESSHGYEISQRYETRFSEVAPLTIPRVYAALDRLRDDGLIEPLELDQTAEVPTRRHLMRRSYRATSDGIQAYRGWLVDQLRDDPLRARLLERILSVSNIGASAVLEVIDRYAQVCLEQLRELPAPVDAEGGSGGDLDQLAGALLVDQQRRELRARYDWAVHAREVIETRVGERSAEA
jgi:DNA-binding PadR family transcriptional regulator